MKLDLHSLIDAITKMSEKKEKVFPNYITHIRFPLYKNIERNCRIDFNFPITALVGPNGSGKTSVLNAIYGAPYRYSTGEYWFSTEVDPILEGEGSPNRFIYGHFNKIVDRIVETRKARVQKKRDNRPDPNYWEPTKESSGDGMETKEIPNYREVTGRSKDRWNPVRRKVVYINFRSELSAFDKYFYFGHDPSIDIAKKKDKYKEKGEQPPNFLITDKKERIIRDAKLLARVVKSGDTSVSIREKPVAKENRLLNTEELSFVSYVLGRKYEEARWIRHNLFQGDDGISIIFKTNHIKYSEAFAGSGEVAVTSCIVNVVNAQEGDLILLDEPEVSLHPGAQIRLLSFLAEMVKRKKLQVVFSTHSPNLISKLPDNAIKSFYQLPSGEFGVIPSTHPYAAFKRLGDTNGCEILVLVEDRLARHVVNQAIHLLADTALQKVFKVEYMPGGADSILTKRIPMFCQEKRENILVLLDGDKKQCDAFPKEKEIPASDNDKLEKIIMEKIGSAPMLLTDGGSNGGNINQKYNFYRTYLEWVEKHLKYLPLGCPEELVIKAYNVAEWKEGEESQYYKNKLAELAKNTCVDNVSSKEIDDYGNVVIGTNREKLRELDELKNTLETFAKSIRR